MINRNKNNEAHVTKKTVNIRSRTRHNTALVIKTREQDIMSRAQDNLRVSHAFGIIENNNKIKVLIPHLKDTV